LFEVTLLSIKENDIDNIRHVVVNLRHFSCL